MELRHLRYFVTVAEAGSVVSAARALNVAQPALSRQIMALERTVGVALFERLPHGVRLTPAGKKFLGEARRALEAVRRGVDRARGSGTVAQGELRVVYGELLAYWTVLADLLHRSRVVHPMVHMRAWQMAAPQMPSALREGRADVAVVAVAQWPVRGLEGFRLLESMQAGALLPADHPAAAHATVRIADLAPLTWFHLPADGTLGVYDAARAALRERGLKVRHRAARVGSFAGMPQIAAGDGFAFANEALGKSIAAATSGIVYRPFVDPPLPVWLAVLWKKGLRADAALDFIALARKSAKPIR